MDQVKGSIQLSIDQRALSAVLKITPSEDGEAWSLPKIQNYLEEKQVLEGISEEALGKLLSRAAKAEAGSPVEEEIARGVEPQEGSPEYFDWKELPVPPELRREAERVFRKAPPPKIMAVRTEKVKVKKRVVKKPKLPFLAAKEELVEQWDRKRIEEPAPINPKIIAQGFAREGNCLADRRPAEAGKDGRTVSGKPVPAPMPSQPPFYPGDGIKVDRNGVFAEKSGFFRRGSNWAQMLDFLPHSWELSQSKDKANCLLHFAPGHPDAQLPEGRGIIAKAVEELGYGEEQLRPAEEIDQLIRKSIRSGRALERVPISRDRDAFFSVDISPDGLSGLLHICKGSGRGRPLVLKEVGAAIKASGFSGMDFEKIKTDLLEFYKGPELELKDYLLAEGEAPTRGENRELEFFVDFIADTEYEELKETVSRLDSESSYPAASAAKLAWVREGQEVAGLSSAAQGAAGKDVYGKPLPGIAGIDPAVKLLEHVRMEKDRFIAEGDGLLELFEEEGMTVLRIRPHRDAEIRVELAPDKMEAYLTIEPPRGTGSRPDRQQLDSALEEAGVTKGIIEEALSDALEISAAGSPVRRSLIARGKVPDDAGGKRISLAVDVPTGKAVSISQGGRADYRRQDRFVSVKKGDLLAELLPSDHPPEDGWDVSGTVIEAKNAPALDIEISERIERREEGKKLRLFAACDGEFVYEKKSMDILQVHTVSGDVDFSSGNVKFPGTVGVTGSVRSGFSVLAEGHVKIAGSVEASLISSGEDVMIAQGVKGGGKAVVRSKGSIETIFVEQATLLAVEHVSIKNGCLRSLVKCNGKVRLVGEKGVLIGGVVRAREGVYALDIGNAKGVRTEISFGQDYLVMDRIEQEEREIKKIRDQLAKLDQLMAGFEKHGHQQQLDRARKEKVKLLKHLEKRGLRLFTLRERFEQHYESEIHIRGTIYPGVVVESHGRYWSTDSPKKQVRLRFDQEHGYIVEEEDKGETRS